MGRLIEFLEGANRIGRGVSLTTGLKSRFGWLIAVNFECLFMIINKKTNRNGEGKIFFSLD